MDNTATVAISSDFLTAFSKLPRQIQGKVTEFINKFRINPKSSGINLEKLPAIDKNIRSVRIDNTYRGIVVYQEESSVYLLLWVDHHIGSIREVLAHPYSFPHLPTRDLVNIPKLKSLFLIIPSSKDISGSALYSGKIRCCNGGILQR